MQRHVEGPTLHDRLQEDWRGGGSSLARLATELLGALEVMAKASGGPIAHNAITPRAIIMQKGPGGQQAHLTTFCSAEQLPEPDSPDAPPASTNSSLSYALAGDLGYAAPEAQKGQARVGISDAYSVGAVLAAAATGHPPKFKIGGLWMGPDNIKDTRMTDVIQGLLQRDWRLRLTASQAAEVLRGGPMPDRPIAQTSFLLSLSLPYPNEVGPIGQCRLLCYVSMPLLAFILSC